MLICVIKKFHLHFLTIVGLGTSSEVNPSGYAYLEYLVYKSERASANCKNYPAGLQANIYTHYYVYCNGTQLRLTDCDYGSEQYTTSDYYAWPAGSGNSQLLFIFPTRVNLNRITLRYYSDSARGLPKLRFYAVPDDFDIWDPPTASYSYLDVAAVPPGGEPSGQRNFSVGFIVTTTKVLLQKFSSSYTFAVSEVKFFNHSCKYRLHVWLSNALYHNTVTFLCKQ